MVLGYPSWVKNGANFVPRAHCGYADDSSWVLKLGFTGSVHLLLTFLSGSRCNFVERV